MVNNTKTLRQLNKAQLLDELKKVSSATKNSLAKSTNLSVATCGNILKECLITGQVFEIELGQSTGGRPSRQFIFNKNHCYTACIYPRHEGNCVSISVSVNNLIGEIIYENHIECNLNIVDALDEIITDLLTNFPSIKALSFGIPGVVNHGLIGICDIKELIDFHFTQYFDNKYKLPITVDNDVNLSALGFYNKNSEKGALNIAYIYFPVDGHPGAGIIINGQIINGFSNFAGEVSYMPAIISRHIQGNIQQNPSDFATYVAVIIMNINCVINPKTIVLSGYCFNDEILTDISSNLTKYSRINYVPDIIFEEDLHESYMQGLIVKALQLLKEDTKWLPYYYLYLPISLLLV